ncbi:transposase-like protein%2C IS1202 [Streptococcus pneumoniae]|nr:transposase-like protein%2C IS1202 [Streptococcus pneumoniae]
MDASPHAWFGAQTSNLHLAIDDASGNILGAYFDKQETLNAYYHVLEQILDNHGIPLQTIRPTGDSSGDNLYPSS